MLQLDPEVVSAVVLHCSASKYGDVETFTEWHKDRGWDTIGYHWVISNCYPTYSSIIVGQPDPHYDGVVHLGRPEQYQGAHAKGHNEYTIGICLVGEDVFSSTQIYAAINLISSIRSRFPNNLEILGHYELTTAKTCPNIDMDYFRSLELSIDSAEPPIFDPSILNSLI